jgi:hypothetical protein
MKLISCNHGLMTESLLTLDVMGYDLSDLTALSDIHLQALARNAVRRGLPNEVRDQRLRVIHELISEIGTRKPRVGVADHVKCARYVVNAGVASRRLCWSAVGISVDGVIRRMQAREPHLTMQMRLQGGFGVARRQLYGLRPHHADHGNSLEVLEVDRRRKLMLPIDCAEKRALVEAAKALVDQPGAVLHPNAYIAVDVLTPYQVEDGVDCGASWNLARRGAKFQHEMTFAATPDRVLPPPELQSDRLRPPHAPSFSESRGQQDALSNHYGWSRFQRYAMRRTSAGAATVKPTNQSRAIAGAPHSH